MAKHSSVLTGTAGVYHVASQLAIRGFHAAVTYGNAPSVDILVGLADGAATLSLQVKTSRWALRTRGRGKSKQPHHYEWSVGEKSAKLKHEDLFFAFVDLKLWMEQLPDIFIVPSKVVVDDFKSGISAGYVIKRWIWKPWVEKVTPYKNNWDVLRNHLQGKSQATRSQPP
jgi:hypothetical protein